MNFLMRTTTGVHAAERSPIPEPRADTHHRSASTGSSLGTVISDDPYAFYDAEVDSATPRLNSKHDLSAVINKHLDVSEEEGCIIIPCEGLPENWNRVPAIQSLCSLDRSFLFPGEQVHILACLSACKQDMQINAPFEVAVVTSQSDIGHSPEKENRNIENRSSSVSGEGEPSTSCTEKLTDDSDGESLHRMEVDNRQTASVLQKFENSHFFVRISESDEPLWSKRNSSEQFSNSFEANYQKASTIKIKETAFSYISEVIDRGNFDAIDSGGVARNSFKYCVLPDGDIVVLLQVNVGVNFLRDPCIEILQFEKCQERMLFPDSQSQVDAAYATQDPCAELLNWILPLDNRKFPPRPLPPHLTSNSGIGNNSQRSDFSASSGSQLFSFGNFRSYSMSSIPQSTNTPPATVKAASSKPSFDIEDWDPVSSQKYFWRKFGVEGLLSFRGVSLERDRFSVCCGLEGLYAPGRRWRRKVEIIQPLEIHSFSADFNSEDLLCVQIKNVAPAHAPDIVIFIDAISIVSEESTKNGTLSSLPISCIEAGNDHSLPNLALRRGEEHSFILKPATSEWKSLKVHDDRSSQLSKLQFRNKITKSKLDRRKIALVNQYAIMVSCRCNYTASRLFFKQPTNWRPRTSRDIMISVASEMARQSSGAYEKTWQLPIQILTLQASNLTSEDLTLTVLSPASFTSPSSVISLNSPTTPLSPFIGFAEFLGRSNGGRGIGTTQGQSFSSVIKENDKESYDDKAQSVSMSHDGIPSSGLSCTHLWLQSRVPLGCIPSRSMATIKLELLPLTCGIITLDSLQIDVKEKGVAYIPECSPKINVTCSSSKGII